MSIQFVDKTLAYITVGGYGYPHTIWGSATSKLYTTNITSTKSVSCSRSDEDGSNEENWIVHDFSLGLAGPPGISLADDGNLHFVFPVGSATMGWAEYDTDKNLLNRNVALYTDANYIIESVAIGHKPGRNMSVIVAQKKIIPPVNYKLKILELQDDGNIALSATLFSSSTYMTHPRIDWDLGNDKFYLAFTLESGSNRTNMLYLVTFDFALVASATINSGVGYGSILGVAVSNEGFTNTVTQMGGDLSWQRWVVYNGLSAPDQTYDQIVDESLPILQPSMSINKKGGYLNFVAYFPTDQNIGLWRWQDEDQDSGSPAPAFDLQTNNETNPLDVDPAGAVTFQWKPQQAQTAYQAQVSTSPTFESTVWDSGKTAQVISASATASATYGGPTLDEDETYYWRVYYWNGGDDQSLPQETPAQFRTGFADSFMLGDLGNEYVFAVAPWPYQESETKFINVRRQVDKRGRFYAYEPFATIQVNIRSASATMIDNLRTEWERGIPLILVPWPRSDKIHDFRNKISGSASPIPHELTHWGCETIASATIGAIETNGTEFTDSQYFTVSRRNSSLNILTTVNAYKVILAKFDLTNWITTYGIESISRIVCGFVGDGWLVATDPEYNRYGWRIEAFSNEANGWKILDYDENRPNGAGQFNIGHYGVVRHGIQDFLNVSNEIYFRIYMNHPRDTDLGQVIHLFSLNFIACYVNSFVVAINDFPPRYVAPFREAGFDLSLICQEI